MLHRFTASLLVAAAFSTAFAESGAPSPADTGALSPAILAELRDGFTFDEKTRVIHNAVTNNNISDLVLNRSVVQGEDGHFSHRIKTGGVTNQKASGRCWMFAGLNTMRPRVIEAKKLDGFEFSTAYLQFYDKLEKSNLFLEYMIEMRDTDYLDRDWEMVHKWTLDDGGWWQYVVELVEKYGVVPKSAMPETRSSEDTGAMNLVLERMLYAQAVKLRAMHKEGKSVAQLREQKKKVLADVYRFLVINLGQPPATFEWRYEGEEKKGDKEKGEKAGKDAKSDVKDDVDKKDEPPTSVVKGLTPMRKYTPQEFYKEYVNVPLRDYVTLYNDATSPFGKHYRFSRSRNMAGAADVDFVNLEISALKAAVKASILANEPVWFASDVGKDQSAQLGLMADRLYDYGPLFGVDLTMSKADRVRHRAEVSNHAMVFMGMDLRDERPVKWLVENSWGEQKGKRGTWTLYDAWFSEHVFAVIINKKHVPAEVLKVFAEPATTLPTWYPGAMGVR